MQCRGAVPGCRWHDPLPWSGYWHWRCACVGPGCFTALLLLLLSLPPPRQSITCVSKHSNLGFPNSIKIRRGAFVDTLTSFLSRGAAFELVSRMVAAQQQARWAGAGVRTY